MRGCGCLHARQSHAWRDSTGGLFTLRQSSRSTPCVDAVALMHGKATHGVALPAGSPPCVNPVDPRHAWMRLPSCIAKPRMAWLGGLSTLRQSSRSTPCVDAIALMHGKASHGVALPAGFPPCVNPVDPRHAWMRLPSCTAKPRMAWLYRSPCRLTAALAVTSAAGRPANPG